MDRTLASGAESVGSTPAERTIFEESCGDWISDRRFFVFSFGVCIKEPLNKSLRASAGSFSACRCQIPLDVAMLRLRGLFLDSRKNPSTDARIDLISVSLKANLIFSKKCFT